MIIADATVSHRKLPCNLADSDLKLFENFLSKKIEEAKLLTFEDVNIGYNGIIFKGWQIYKVSVNYGVQLEMGMNKFSIHTLKGFSKLFMQTLFPKGVLHVEEDCLWIIDQYSWSYFRWFCNAIPKLFASMQLRQRPKLLVISHSKKEG